jgi:lipoprotein-anchoring transpeptidase ErfK/SrfK
MTTRNGVLPLDRHDAASSIHVSRRAILSGWGATALVNFSGCSHVADLSQQMGLDVISTGAIFPTPALLGDRSDTDHKSAYSSVTDNGIFVPAVPYQKVKPEFRRQVVKDPTNEAPGTIVVVLRDRHLYWVEGGGMAVRYGVGVGKAGFEWNGRAVIQYAKVWPTWTPPKEMIARKPELVQWASGQPGGIDNPLGARAHYIYKNDTDTGYRVHGSPEWWSIGTQASSGCIRMINQDVIDLYVRVKGSHAKVPIVVI